MGFNLIRSDFIAVWRHKLFHCPTFWKLRPYFKCPRCGKKYRCYWEGNDVANYGNDYCDACATMLNRINQEKENGL